MLEQTEWEVMDDTTSANAQSARRIPVKLGPWWKWKLAAIGVLAGAVFLILAVLASAFMLVVSVGLIAAVGARKLGLWLRRTRAGDGISVHPR
jgi:hypothetical protein